MEKHQVLGFLQSLIAISEKNAYSTKSRPILLTLQVFSPLKIYANLTANLNNHLHLVLKIAMLMQSPSLLRHQTPADGHFLVLYR